jgi:pyruvate/2-oxoglutarate/acetoin dehydrogenase E1 component/TPP-dependent pyruvate/acetoin dehydrogenase alpha subunit
MVAKLSSLFFCEHSLAVYPYFCHMGNQTPLTVPVNPELSFESFRQEVLSDYQVVCLSREASLLGRKEVLTGKAKFGIFGDGKEVAQVAMAKFFRPGDWRSGYYRDQTFHFAIGQSNVQQFFAQLYADPDINNDTNNAGRQMVSHFATQNVDTEGNWIDLTRQKNTASDMAPTASQLPRSLGLAYASKVFRNLEPGEGFDKLSNGGNEVCFCTIGDASTSEGHFWETVNAAGVLQVPVAFFVWDDGYGISVPKKYQTTKASISVALSGMQKEPDTNGINIYKIKGWDYAGMCEAFEEGIRIAREKHIPVLFHVEEITQPQGHSTSGSHERYKTQERLAWEREWDGVKQMREWIIQNALSNDEELRALEAAAKNDVKNSKDRAWEAYQQPIKAQTEEAVKLLNELADKLPDESAWIKKKAQVLTTNREPLRRDILKTLHDVIVYKQTTAAVKDIDNYYKALLAQNKELYNSFLYNEGPKSALHVPEVKAVFEDAPKSINGYEVLNKYFDQLFTNNPKVVAFGEDLGFIGDVNQGFSGLQEKHGAIRIFDTGIRELTIMGQGIGLALRGLRPIAEIQYIDYVLYGLQPLSDDVATLHYRTYGRQSCPLIVRTRGHRLEGIWHSGSPMGMMINALRGMYLCVPRNMTQAVGMYNTLLQGNDPGIVVECLNGYRLKETPPSNLLEMTVPLGVPEVIKQGEDITIVSYGSTLRIIQESVNSLEATGISCEIIDVQTLLPFDIHHVIVESLKKTSRIVFVDEDVPGGAAAYMFNKVMEEQGGYRYLDVAPRTITAKAHRPAYGSDGDYFSKPNAEDIETVIREMMAE